MATATPTKTLRFDPDVLGVIQRMSWNENGTIATITDGQLSRDLYERMNKALTAMGGKWKRGTGHVFAFDPRPQVEGLLASGALTIEKDGFFETPARVVSTMLDLAPLGKTPQMILEPEAGMGAILRVLLDQPTASRHTFYACEKNEERRAFIDATLPRVRLVGGDLMDYNIPKFFERIYMNPPFEIGQDMAHVRHAYGMLAMGGSMVSVMSEGPFFRDDAKAQTFRAWADGVGAISYPLPDHSFRESGTDVNTRLLLIDK